MRLQTSRFNERDLLRRGRTTEHVKIRQKMYIKLPDLNEVQFVLTTGGGKSKQRSEVCPDEGERKLKRKSVNVFYCIDGFVLFNLIKASEDKKLISFLRCFSPADKQDYRARRKEHERGQSIYPHAVARSRYAGLRRSRRRLDFKYPVGDACS